MVRAHIRLNTTQDAIDFVKLLNADGTINKYTIENSAGNCADARSLLGVIYMMSDYCDDCYLVNKTQDGFFPSCIDTFRV